jgi:ribosome recycling factor
LVIQVPPPTAESRKASVGEAGKAGDKASTAIKDARGKQQKKLRGMQVGKTARPDELKKAGAAMEKVVERGGTEVKRIVEAAKKVLESG